MKFIGGYLHDRVKKMKQTLCFIALCLFTISLCILSFPATVFASVSYPNSLFLKQNSDNSCTLAAATMMLRARLYLGNYSDWSNCTENDVGRVAWAPGLRYSFTYTIGECSMRVSYDSLGGLSISSLKSYINSHPEGVVLYCSGVPHAVFITDYEGDVFYCGDSAGYQYSGKRIRLDQSLLGSRLGSQDKILKNTTGCWYISSSNIPGGGGFGISLSNGCYYLKSALNTAYAVTANGSNIELAKFDSASMQQQFVIEKLPDGYFKIWNKVSGKVLDVSNASTAAGANVQQIAISTDGVNDAQRWYFESDGDGYYYICSKLGTTVGVRNGTASAGQNVQTCTKVSSKAQKFQLRLVPPTISVKEPLN